MSTTDTATPAPPQPLAGVRVLDFSQVMAGPYCCMLLGDMGADVVKIEPPGKGDQVRQSMGIPMKGPDSPGFLALNRNKRSLELNLKTAAGLEVFKQLVKTADIFVENSRPGVTARLGIDYPALSAINPKLVYASISGYGQTGPWALRPGFDLIAQAVSGAMSAMGRPDEPPVKSSIPFADLGAGLLAVYGILSAYIGAQHTGVGQHVDTSLFEAAIGLSVWESAEYWGTGQPPRKIGTANRMSAPYQAVQAADGWFVLGAANQRLWQRLCTVIGRPDLADDPRFRTNGERMRNLALLMPILEAFFVERRRDDCVSLLSEAGIPAAPVLDYRESLASEQAVARQMVMQLEHPVEGTINNLGFAVKMSITPQQVRRAPPLLGQHTEELLAELGLDPEAIAELRAAGALSP